LTLSILRNYWVNMQSCVDGLKDIEYDLQDSSRWEFMVRPGTFFFNPRHRHSLLDLFLAFSPTLHIPPSQINTLTRTTQFPEPTKDDVTINIAPSWVEKLSLEPRDYQTRCPHGHRTVQMESSIVDIYAEYLREDGLVKQYVPSGEKENKICGVGSAFWPATSMTACALSTPTSHVSCLLA
jgi:hypothetical protein